MSSAPTHQQSLCSVCAGSLSFPSFPVLVFAVSTFVSGKFFDFGVLLLMPGFNYERSKARFFGIMWLDYISAQALAVCGAFIYVRSKVRLVVILLYISVYGPLLS